MPIRITSNPKDSTVMYVQVWGDHWEKIKNYLITLPNTRWKEEQKVYRMPIDNMQAVRDFMTAECPGDKRFCDDACLEIIKSYFSRLDMLKNIKASADVDLSAIYPQLHLEQFTKTGGEPGEYQKIGATWLAMIGRGVLGDAYGVGKTIQAIMAALILQHRGLIDFVVVIGTRAASFVWEKEIKKFTTSSCIRVSGKDRHRQYGSRFFTATTYAKIIEPKQKKDERLEDFLRRKAGSDFESMKSLLKSGRCLFIVDEFHKCARRTARRTKACTTLSEYAEYRFGISADGGFQNEGQDLFNTYGIIDKNILGNWDSFRKMCLVPKWGGGYKVTERGRQWIASRTANYLLRRTRDQIGIERKDLKERTVYVGFSPYEKGVYDEADAGVFSTAVDDNGELVDCRLADITRMRQACLSPWLLDEKNERVSSKLDMVADMADEILGGDDSKKIIIYCFYKTWFPLVIERLKDYGVVEISGSVKNFTYVENKFNNDPNIRVAVITDAGAESISLPAASTTLMCTVPWNQSKYGQMGGRMDRMTQENDMDLITVVMQDSYEEDMIDIKDAKKEEFDATVEKASDLGNLRMLHHHRKEKSHAHT